MHRGSQFLKRVMDLHVESVGLGRSDFSSPGLSEDLSYFPGHGCGYWFLRAKVGGVPVHLRQEHYIPRDRAHVCVHSG